MGNTPKHFIILKPQTQETAHAQFEFGTARYDFQSVAAQRKVPLQDREIELITGYKLNGLPVFDHGEKRTGRVLVAAFEKADEYEAFKEALMKRTLYPQYIDFVTPTAAQP